MDYQTRIFAVYKYLTYPYPNTLVPILGCHDFALQAIEPQARVIDIPLPHLGADEDVSLRIGLYSTFQAKNHIFTAFFP